MARGRMMKRRGTKRTGKSRYTRRGRKPLSDVGMLDTARTHVRAYTRRPAVRGARTHRVQLPTIVRTVNEEREHPVPTEIAEVSHITRKFGRPMKKNLSNLYRLMRPVMMQSQLYRYEACNKYCTTGAGRNKLYNHYYSVSTTVDPWQTGNALITPMHVYDLSAFPNVNPLYGVGAGQVGLGAPMFYTRASQDLCSFSRRGDAVDGLSQPINQLGDYVGDHCWMPEDINGDLLQNAYRASFWKWLDLKLVCYGRTTCPTRYSISLVQVADEDCNYGRIADREFSTNTSDYTITPQPTEFSNHIRSLTSQYTYSPIHYQNPRFGQKKWKTIWSEDFTINSTQSNEGSNTIPHMKVVKLFKYMNRLQRYDWDAQANISSSAIADDDDYIKTNTSFRTTVEPKKRVFLVIRAQATYTTGPAPAWNIAQHPSYDICIRVKHEKQY